MVAIVHRREMPGATGAALASTVFGLAACSLPDAGLLGADASTSTTSDAGHAPPDAGHDATVDGSKGHPRDAGQDTEDAPPDVGVPEVGLPEVGPPVCASACATGASCGANAACLSLQCIGGHCVACSPTCGVTATCNDDGDCASGLCSDGNCVAILTSCAAVLAANPAAPSGAYPIKPTGAPTSFMVYCDMTHLGGGWTLVAKMGAPQGAGDSTFKYSSSYWTAGGTLAPNSTDLTPTEALFPSYGSVPFQSILAVMTAIPAATNTANPIVLPIGDPVSLQHLINSTAEDANAGATAIDAGAWLGLTTPTAMLQSGCNQQGINRGPSGGCVDPGTARVRIGLLANNGGDCCTPDSYVGFGGEYDNGSCNPVSLSAGAMVGAGCNGGQSNIFGFGYVFVR